MVEKRSFEFVTWFQSDTEPDSQLLRNRKSGHSGVPVVVPVAVGLHPFLHSLSQRVSRCSPVEKQGSKMS